MRLSSLLCVTALAPAALAAALRHSDSFAPPSGGGMSRQARGLGNYDLDGFLPMKDLDGKTTTTQATTHDHAGEATAPAQQTPALDALSPTNALTSVELTTSTTTGEPKHKPKETTSTGPATTSTSSSPTAINRLPTSSPPPTPTAAPPPTDPSPVGAAEATSAAESTGAREWKIIGVAVIAFSSVAAVLLLSVFFDQWWRFLRDVLWRRRRGADMDGQELVPDWEKAEWELRCGHDRQRYPSFSSDSLPASLPSVPIVPAVAHPQPAAVSKRGNVETLGRGPVRSMDETLGLGGSSSSTSAAAGTRVSVAGPGMAGVGLGIGRVGEREGMASPRQQPAARVGQTYATQHANPFDDSNSPMPDDIYGGMMH